MQHRQESMEFLIQSYNGKGELSEFEDLCSWYFGSADRTIKICAHRAYRDFCRRLTGLGKCTVSVKTKWRDDEEKIIADAISGMLNRSDLNRESFDSWHNMVCCSLIDAAQNAELPLCNGFSYGLAQKWLNMTLKNMIIMEQWSAKLDMIKPYLHVPVDSYIMEAAAKIDIVFINKNSQYCKYKETISKPWSQWNSEEYINFQNALRNKQPVPIDWEGPAWIEIAKIRKERESKS